MLITKQSEEAIRINKERDAVYGDGFRIQAPLSRHYTRKAGTMKTQEDFIRAYLVDMMMTRLIRFMHRHSAPREAAQWTARSTWELLHLLHGYDAHPDKVKTSQNSMSDLAIEIYQQMDRRWHCSFN